MNVLAPADAHGGDGLARAVLVMRRLEGQSLGHPPTAGLERPDLCDKAGIGVIDVGELIPDLQGDGRAFGLGQYDAASIGANKEGFGQVNLEPVVSHDGRWVEAEAIRVRNLALDLPDGGGAVYLEGLTPCSGHDSLSSQPANRLGHYTPGANRCARRSPLFNPAGRGESYPSPPPGRMVMPVVPRCP